MPRSLRYGSGTARRSPNPANDRIDADRSTLILRMTTRRTQPSRSTPDRRAAILAELRSSADPLGVADLATTLDGHPNTVRFHLEALTAEGRVEECADTRESVGRPRRLYRAAPGMDRGGPTNYRLLAELLVENLAADPEAVDRATEMGRRWGQAHARTSDDGAASDPATARERLRSLLERLDFAPAPSPDGDTSTIGLGHCPFLETVGEHPNVVCAIHLGLMRGALDGWAAPLTVDALEPFGTPDRCLVRVRDT